MSEGDRAGAAQGAVAPTSPASLRADGVSVFDPRGAALVRDVCFALQPGALSVLIGPNGAGKTSLMRALAGLSPGRAAGAVRVLGEDISSLSPAARARRLAYLPQQQSLAWPQPVRDIVALGRFAYGARPGRLGADDRRAVAQAMRDCGLEALGDRAADTLSGGESASMAIARTLCAETPIVLADEPVAALDPRAAHEAIRLFHAAAHERGAAVLLVVHDLHLAAAYAERILWLKDGLLVADGTPEETLSAERLADVFAIDAAIEHEPGSPPKLHLHGPA